MFLKWLYFMIVAKYTSITSIVSVSGRESVSPCEHVVVSIINRRQDGCVSTYPTLSLIL